MVLAVLLRRHPDELRADFQQHYGLNIDDMGGSYSLQHAATLAAQLPRDSRTLIAENPECEWNLTNTLLGMIEFHAHNGWYVHTEDARSGANAPQPLMPWARGREGRQGESMGIDEYTEFLSRPRKEVDEDGGQ